MNRGGVGARSLNIELQKALNPPGEVRVERFGWTYAPGGKVMQIENDYDKEVYNGDLGIVDRIDLETGDLEPLPFGLIPTCFNYDGFAQARDPTDVMVSGAAMSLFQAWQHWVRMAS